MPLVAALKEYSQSKPAYFCVPGHRFGRGISEEWVPEKEKGVFNFDLTEATGLDDLHQPGGAIKEAQELTAQLFRTRKSFFLVNGTTCGNEAMILSCVQAGDKIIVPRNAHKSVLAGLILSGATPVYVTPEWIPEWGIWGGCAPEKIRKLLKEQPEIKAVLMVTPSYYGLVDKLDEISAVCREFDCRLLVDEAHGAHLYFSDELPAGALTSGADMCVQSFHKVTGSLTQSSVLHVAAQVVDTTFLQENLQMLQSSSPSYLLMASLDAARYELAKNGEAMSGRALSLAQQARTEINKIMGVHCLGKEIIGRCAVNDIDLTKLVITARDIGLSGFELKEMLMSEYGVETELADYHNVLAIITFANIESEIDKLIKAIDKIARNHRKETAKRLVAMKMPPVPMMQLTPREAHFSLRKRVTWQSAIGQVAGEAIIPYPPGIPIVYPGEIITPESWEYIEGFRKEGCHFHGVADEQLVTIAIIEQTNEANNTRI